MCVQGCAKDTADAQQKEGRASTSPEAGCSRRRQQAAQAAGVARSGTRSFADHSSLRAGRVAIDRGVNRGSCRLGGYRQRGAVPGCTWIWWAGDTLL